MRDHLFAPWRGLAVLLAITAATWSAASSPRAPTFEIASESRWDEFGALIGADGPHVVASDRSRPGRSVVRIWSTANGALEETRFEGGRDEKLIGLDVSGARLVTESWPENQLVFYEHRLGRWAPVQTLFPVGGCIGSYARLDLAGDVLVTSAYRKICVFEHVRGAWKQTAELPVVTRRDGIRPFTNGDRIAYETDRPSGIRLFRRTTAGWTFEQQLAVPPGREALTMALTKHWLAVTYVDEETWQNPDVHVYALGPAVVPVAVLQPQRDDRYFGWSLAMSDRALVCIGRTQQVFELTGAGWSAHGELARINPEAREDAAVGDHAWIGESGGYGGPPGMLFGYRL